jgi:hypothetical protein
LPNDERDYNIEVALMENGFLDLDNKFSLSSKGAIQDEDI